MRCYGTDYTPKDLATLIRLGDWETAADLYELWDGDRLDAALTALAVVADQTGASVDEWWEAAQRAAATHALDTGWAALYDAHPHITMFADISVDEVLWLIDHTLDGDKLQRDMDGVLATIEDDERRGRVRQLFLHRMAKRARLMRDMGVA